MTRWSVVGLMVCAVASPSLAQIRPHVRPVSRTISTSHGEFHGTIRDDNGTPLNGAVVSALGTTTVFSVTDGEGRFAFRSLPAGPYLVRVHLQGFVPARGRVIQVRGANRTTESFTLARHADASEPPTILSAGVGGETPAPPPSADGHEHGEVAWRLRHQKRSVLKDAEQAIAGIGQDDSILREPFGGVSRAVENSARFASALFTDLTVDGHVNLLTSTWFERPEDLFSMSAESPRGIAYVSLVVPGKTGDWLMRGTVTQGDVSSWIATAAFRRSPDADHAYEAGLSYSAQHYIGGNGEALLIADGSRKVGALYAYDNWAVMPRVRLGYGARYARYDYLPDEGLFSPRVSITLQPSSGDSLLLKAAVSHRETAPGAEEFTPPTVGLWLPPERTFSQVSRGVLRPERLDHVEVGAERAWRSSVVFGVRAFRQRVDDQVVTLFGLAMADRSSIGHYHVGSAGDFEARGFTVNASRAVGDGVRVAVDYTQFGSAWHGRSPDAGVLGQLARSVLRKDERIHDLTASVESIIAASATRLFIMYKLNTGFANANDTTPSALHNVRFNVQVNQGLPFLQAMNANWEMVVAVTNLFRDDIGDSSVYDQLFVIDPPKRVLGGVTMRF